MKMSGERGTNICKKVVSQKTNDIVKDGTAEKDDASYVLKMN